MRLINTTTLLLNEFFGSDIPPYAILSHTWGHQEITFQEWTAWQLKRDPTTISQKEGFVKIQGACNQARCDKLEWLWVDTNCIDKTSSSELSEAINSMYAWYRDSVICYAFLADVPPLFEYDPDPYRHIRRSRWFTRGWTLQELLAPKKLDFYTRTWSRIGSKSGSLIQVINEITDVELSYLSGHMDITMASVAKKMFWLSKRTTTRVEDIAYCMLGIFEINMPLLYGEGMRAFTRLQDEIVRQVHDHTIFCWTWDNEVPSNWVSMLAPSPRVFRDSGDYIQRNRFDSLAHYSMTNLGLSITLPAIYTLGSRLFAVLDAGLSGNAHKKRACVPLRRPEVRALVFERVDFPPKLLNLALYSPQAMTRYSLYALNKPTPSTLKSQLSTKPSKFGVLIFIEPSVSRIIEDVNKLGSGMPANRPLLTKETYTQTHPPHMFDGPRDLLWISPSSDKAGLQNTLTVEIAVYNSKTTTVNDIYYLFFAVDSSTRHPRWHCYMTTRGALGKKMGWSTSDFSISVEEVDRHMKTKFARIWTSGKHYTRHQSSDKLRLAIGKPLDVYPDVEIRGCILSESKEVNVNLDDSEDEGRADASDNDSTCARARRN